MMSCSYNENSLCDYFEFIESFQIFENGKDKLILKTNEEFKQIEEQLRILFTNSRLMPAFGVSLHNETLNEIKSNCWLQVNFNKEIVKNGLPFNALLFRLEETQGFNLIRLYDGKYEGRCLFLDLDKEMDLKNVIY